MYTVQCTYSLGSQNRLICGVYMGGPPETYRRAPTAGQLNRVEVQGKVCEFTPQLVVGNSKS